jgi:hypothetical protein
MIGGWGIMRLHALLMLQGSLIGLRFLENGEFYDIATTAIPMSLDFLFKLNLRQEPVILHNGVYKTPREIQSRGKFHSVVPGSPQHMKIIDILNQHRAIFART